MKVIKLLSVLLIQFLFFNHSNAQTYYIDALNGNDSNSGTTTSSPWRSLAKVNITTFPAGAKILFKASNSWTGQLYPKGSGTNSSPIIIDMYGAGSKPLITGGGTTN